MSRSTFSGTLTIGAIQMAANIQNSGVGEEGHEPALPAGVSGVLTTRTSNNAGVLTLPDGHGFLTNDVLAVFWNDATTGAPCAMYGFLATVAGDAVTFVLAAGEYQGGFPNAISLPPAASVVTVSKKVVSNTSVAHGDVTVIGVNCDQPALGIFGAATAIYAVQVPLPNSPVFWNLASGAANPLGSDPTKMVCYNGGVVAAKFQYGMLLAS